MFQSLGLLEVDRNGTAGGFISNGHLGGGNGELTALVDVTDEVVVVESLGHTDGPLEASLKVFVLSIVLGGGGDGHGVSLMMDLDLFWLESLNIAGVVETVVSIDLTQLAGELVELMAKVTERTDLTLMEEGVVQVHRHGANK